MSHHADSMDIDEDFQRTQRRERDRQRRDSERQRRDSERERRQRLDEERQERRLKNLHEERDNTR